MLTDEAIYEIGMDLELAGFSHSEIDVYFEHHGVKGQKWGVRRQQRNTSRYQTNTVDRIRKVAEGKGNLTDKQIAINTAGWATLAKSAVDKTSKKKTPYSQIVAQKSLANYLKDAQKIKAGKTTLQGVMGKILGVKITDLNVSYKNEKGKIVNR